MSEDIDSIVVELNDCEDLPAADRTFVKEMIRNVEGYTPVQVSRLRNLERHYITGRLKPPDPWNQERAVIEIREDQLIEQADEPDGQSDEQNEERAMATAKCGLNEKQLKVVKEMREAGSKYTAIATKLSVPPWRIYAAANELGISNSKKRAESQDNPEEPNPVRTRRRRSLPTAGPAVEVSAGLAGGISIASVEAKLRFRLRVEAVELVAE